MKGGEEVHIMAVSDFFAKDSIDSISPLSKSTETVFSVQGLML